MASSTPAPQTPDASAPAPTAVPTAVPADASTVTVPTVPVVQAATIGSTVQADTTAPALPTQVAHSWRATARTVFQATIALAGVLLIAIPALHLPASVAGVAAVAVAVAGGITRVMALPAVEAFIQQYLPFLATQPKQ